MATARSGTRPAPIANRLDELRREKERQRSRRRRAAAKANLEIAAKAGAAIIAAAKAAKAGAAIIAAAKARQEMKSEPIRIAKPKPLLKAPTLPLAETQAIALLPVALRPIVKEVMLDPRLNEMGKLFMSRAGEFSNPVKALLAGIALHPPARARFNQHLDQLWQERRALPNASVPEVVIGAGLHAAIYCAARVASGRPAPLVLERSGRVGGAFACSESPSFYLNSRNRPGDLSVPGDEKGALNFLPGAVFQPADLSAGEYQTNDMLAWTIRLALAMYARVMAGRTVTSLGVRGGLINVTLSNGQSFFTKRVIIATGLNMTPRPGDRWLNFESFMAKFDQPFPLRGMKRVAVIGAGDSGKTAVEALLGQGPPHRATLASLDWPQQIDWYGCAQASRADWESCNRSRYRGIGRFLPRNGVTFRLRPKPMASNISRGFNCAYVNETPYDYVIDCRGAEAGLSVATNFVFEQYLSDTRVIANKASNASVYVVGPAAKIPVLSNELPQLAKIEENNASIFRYAGRTAALAAQ